MTNSEHRGDHLLRLFGLCRRLGAATNDWHRTRTTNGFTVNQALVLHHLVVHGDATPSDLANWMHVDRGTVTPTIKRLEELGLLERRQDEADARKHWLVATAEARRITPEIENTVMKPAFQHLKKWDRADVEALNDALERLLATPPFGGEA